MVSTRSQPSDAPPSQPFQNSTSQTNTTAKTKKKRSRNKKQLTRKSTEGSDDADQGNGTDDDNNPPEEEETTGSNKKVSTESAIFKSRFPGLNLNDFEDHLEDWTVVSLRQAIAKQGCKQSKAPSEINSLVQSIRLEYEKRMLMAALMGGVPEVVVWNLVGEGAKKGHSNPWIRFLAFCYLPLAEPLPESGNKEGWTARNKKVSRLWKGLTEEEKNVFRDPFFFALANLPDLSNVPGGDEDSDELDETTLQDTNDSTLAPSVHKLTNEEKSLYQPLFNKLVDVDKLHDCYGKPPASTSVATVQQKSLVELRKAHHAFSVVCQRYQITYYLAAVSCGSVDGWKQVYSNTKSFADWAANECKVPDTLASYVHGMSAVKMVEGSKPRQPSDERKIRLGKELNALVDAVSKTKGNIYPKHEDPEDEIKNRGWLIRIVQKEGSRLTKEELQVGHRLARSSTVKSWLQDIKDGLFVIENIPESELLTMDSAHQKTRKPKTRKPKKKTLSHNSQPDSSETENRLSHFTSTGEPGFNQHNAKRQATRIPDSDDDSDEGSDHPDGESDKSSDNGLLNTQDNHGDPQRSAHTQATQNQPTRATSNLSDSQPSTSQSVSRSKDRSTSFKRKLQALA